MLLGSINLVNRYLTVAAIALHNTSEAELKEVHTSSLLHLSVSKPEGPAVPSVHRAAYLI